MVLEKGKPIPAETEWVLNKTVLLLDDYLRAIKCLR